MLSIPVEIILIISEHLSDTDKIRFSMTCRRIDKLKSKFIYVDKHCVDRIIYLSFLDNIKHVAIFPYYVSFIPQKITHLTFTYDFNISVYGCIPTSVTHLTFGKSFNTSIDNMVLPNVTHLMFGYFFD